MAASPDWMPMCRLPLIHSSLSGGSDAPNSTRWNWQGQLVQPPRSVVAIVDHARGRLLHRGLGGGARPIWIRVRSSPRGRSRRTAEQTERTPRGRSPTSTRCPAAVKPVWTGQRCATIATGPPPSGPWCSAPPETKSCVCPTSPASAPPTKARAWRVELMSESSSMV